MSDARLKAARKAAQEAEDRYRKVIRDVCPIGSRVCWTYHNGLHCGPVLMHSHDTRIKVRNDLTGKEYWIDAYWVQP